MPFSGIIKDFQQSLFAVRAEGGFWEICCGNSRGALTCIPVGEIDFYVCSNDVHPFAATTFLNN